MPLDIENLGSAPDLENIDFDKLDRGDSLEAVDDKVDQKDDVKDEVVDQKDDDKDEVVDQKDDDKDEVDEKPRDDKGRFEARVPKSRFDEAVSKEREAREAAERRAADAERRLAEQARSREQQVDRGKQLEEMDSRLDELEKQRDTALLEGDTEKAATLGREIRTMNRQMARMETQADAQQIVSSQIENQRLEAAIARLEADHPMLNPQSEVFDPDIVQMVLMTQDNLVNGGIPPAQAMLEAAQRVMQKIDKLRSPVKEDEGKKGLGEAKQDPERTKKAVDKALDTQKRQPSTMKDAGVDSDKHGEKGLPDVSQMSSEEYAALPEATRARLRGDLL